MIEHCTTFGKTDVQFILHGGEPLLGGLKHLRQIVSVVEQAFAETDIRCKLAIQSNGLLFTEQIGDFLLEKQINLGISLDGPPEVNDQFRKHFNGKGTSRELETRLRLLAERPYNAIFSGFLAVINPDTDPIATYDYLAQFNPYGMDFLLPYDNWDRRPLGKENADSTVYGDWLIRLFDYWFELDRPRHIKMFHSYMRVLLGGTSTLESIGLSPVDLIVIETNGEIEAVDSLKASFNGATELGYSIFEHSFDEVLDHVNVQARQIGADALCDQCRRCPVVDYCGGGYVPNRYSARNGFNNPSIYCRDLEKMIRHMHQRLSSQLNHDYSHETDLATATI
ncbi:hypothetical protein AWR27_05525 [Spirosoma montaniterrae]|uniref:Radical SAM protein n=2 Tax=Spirosoma montaniterrae TaxID=1178516 RepID=A0A1P9WTX6_9BACT|nr:hypothetical protein AWR27_05525 [Spirosoma montaniterrae]